MWKQIALVLWLSVSSAYAQSEDDFKAATVRVGTSSSWCSGVVVVKGRELAYGLSAAHCASGEGDTFKVYTQDGDWGNARWVRIDHKVDLALFLMNSEDAPNPIPVIGELPVGAAWISIGHPGGDRRPHVKVLQPSGQHNHHGGRNFFLVRSGHFAGGDSGGPAFASARGVSGVAGIMTHGQDDISVCAAQHKQVVKFLSDYESEMAADCRDCWRYPTKPKVPGPPTTGQHGLPDHLDSDRDRAKLIEQLLKDVKSLKEQNTALEKKLYELATSPPPVEGPKGDTGDRGPEGPKGEKGDPGEVPEEWETRLSLAEKRASALDRENQKLLELVQNQSTLIQSCLDKLDAQPSEEELLADFLKQIPPRRVILTKDRRPIKKNGKVVGVKEYAIDEAIILDVRDLIKQK